MTWSSLLKKPSALLPFLMSLAALSLVLGVLAVNGPHPDPAPHDEGAAAHIFQLLLALQVPVALAFMARWVPREPRKAIAVLALQVVAGLIALAPVVILEW